MSMAYDRPAWTTLAMTAALALFASLAFAYSKPVEVRVDGQPMLSDVAPVTTGRNGVFVPLRPLGNAMGAETRYEPRSGDVQVLRGDQVLHVKVGATHATLNGMPMTLKQAPFRVRGRVMIGLKTVSRAFGVRVSYSKRNHRIDVMTSGMVAADAQTPEAP